MKKLAVYRREGVAHAWIVDPLAQTLEVLRLESGRWTITGTWAGSAELSAEPFAELTWDLTMLWDQPAQTPSSPPIGAR